MEEHETGMTGVEELPADCAVMPDGNVTPGTVGGGGGGGDIMSLMEFLLEDRTAGNHGGECMTGEGERKTRCRDERTDGMFQLVESTMKGKKDSGEAFGQSCQTHRFR